MPKLDYPAVFDGEMIGVRVKEDINHNEAFCCVPLSLSISVDKARQNKDLKEIYDAHPSFFGEDDNNEWEHRTIELFVLYEMQKGEKSFWHPYFEVMPKLTNFWFWDEEQIKATDDPFLTCEMHKIKQYMDKNYNEMALICLQHPGIIKPGFLTKELYRHVEVSVSTRVFGYSIPCTALFPMADMLNHSDIDV